MPRSPLPPGSDAVAPGRPSSVISTTTRAVSYTHLDVYKRQVERVFGRVRAATVRSVGGTRVAVLASVFSVDLAVVLSVGEALADVLLSAQVEEDLEQVLPETVA